MAAQELEQAFITQAVAQVVTQSAASTGNTFNVTSMIAQVVNTGAIGNLRVSQIAAQVVTQATPGALRVAQMAVQILVQNLAASGGHFRVSSVTPQVIFSVGVPDTDRQKAWTFDYDGHTFYVLDLAENGAIAYDLTTNAWSVFDTAGYDGHFNMKNGFHWRDGKEVLGGGILNGLLVGLDEGSYLDEGFRPVAYEVNGVIFSTTEEYRSNYALRLIGSPGRLGDSNIITPPVLSMIYSDDNGANWSDPQAVTLSTDSQQRIEFRSLGSFRQPGRLFKLYDNGGVKFIAAVMADVEGE